MRKFFRNHKIFLTLLLILILSLIVQYFALNTKIEHVRFLISSSGTLAPFLYILLFSLGFILPLASILNSVLFLVAGLLFSPLDAIFYTLIADLVGISVNFFLARRYGISLLNKFLKDEQVKQIQKFTGKITWEFIAILRLLPGIGNLGIDIVSYASGLSRIRWIIFVISTLIPWAVIDFVHFFSLNYFVLSSNGIFLLPLYLFVTIPTLFLMLRRRKEYEDLRKELWHHLNCWYHQVKSELTSRPVLEKW